MGNTKSEFVDEATTDPWWQYDATGPKELKRETKEEIMAEISTIHEKRLKLISEKKQEMSNLRDEVTQLKSENEQIKLLLEVKRTSFEVPGDDLSGMMDLQKKLSDANAEISAFETERKEYKTHVIALKDIITVSKQLLLMKESQMKELSVKVEEIQATLAQKELEVLSDDVRKEFEKQLKSIKQLKLLYEDRQEALRKENSGLKTKLNEATVDLAAQEAQNKDLQSRIDALEKDNSDKSSEIFNVESQLGLSKADCRELQSQLTVINQLFSQILTGFNNGQEVNLDKLVRTLEENHDLLKDIVCNEECNEASSALPKVLLDLVNQVNVDVGVDANHNAHLEDEAQTSEPSTLNSASEIVQNLPKVWRVLIELLSHQTAPVSVLNENDPNSCYKSVQTPTGPTLVVSVSKTFIRLKNLIVEKKSLEKETTRLKQLNTHLETRLQDQEKRLERVSQEVAKTWHVVGKMQKQHELLHTQENILRYELAQKRKLLNELKEELEYCREKWLQAREKNAITEKQWKQLQSEFASRKRIISEDFNNSTESGYSDDRESSNSDSDEDHVQSFPKKRTEDAAKATKSSPTILKVVQEEIANIEGTSPNEEETDPVKIKHADISNTYKRLEEHILETIKKTQNGEDFASTSTFNKFEEAPVEDLEIHSVTEAVKQEEEVVEVPLTCSVRSNQESILSKREQRLQRLEEETKQLVGIFVKNAFRGEAFCSKLNMLHDRYGGSTSSNENTDSVVEEGGKRSYEESVQSSHEENIESAQHENVQSSHILESSDAEIVQSCHQENLQTSREENTRSCLEENIQNTHDDNAQSIHAANLQSSLAEIVKGSQEENVQSFDEQRIVSACVESVQSSREENVQSSHEENVQSSHVESSDAEIVQSHHQENLQTSREENTRSCFEENIQNTHDDNAQSIQAANLQSSLAEIVEGSQEENVQSFDEQKIVSACVESVPSSREENVQSSHEENVQSSHVENSDAEIDQSCHEENLQTSLEENTRSSHEENIQSTHANNVQSPLEDSAESSLEVEND